MAYYRTCPHCGAALDPGEHCDCKKNTAPEAANNRSGKTEQGSTKLNYSAAIVSNGKRGCQV